MSIGNGIESGGQVKTFHVVYCFDRRFVLPSMVSLYSLWYHCSAPSQLCAWLMHMGELDAVSHKRIRRVLNRCKGMRYQLRKAEPFCDVQRLGAMHLSQAALIRIGLADSLPETVNRLLYLDGDTLVLRDVLGLDNFPMNGNPIAAVIDSEIPNVSAKGGIGYAVGPEGLDPAQAYFNSGVILMDLAAYRAGDFAQKSLAFLRRYQAKLRFADQDALNAVIGGRFCALGSDWNRSWEQTIAALSSERFAQVEQSKSILHYYTEEKPWNEGGSKKKTWYYQRWLRRSGVFSPFDWCSYMLRFVGGAALRKFKVK